MFVSIIFRNVIWGLGCMEKWCDVLEVTFNLVILGSPF